MRNKVSVVMSVFDKPADVVLSVNSVLSQTGLDFEFIIVSDGANEKVNRELKKFDDPRLQIIYQENRGLTQALIKACNEASYDFIARIDAGDEMRPQRLQKQADFLNNNPDTALVSCWVSMRTDEGFHLYNVCQRSNEMALGITAIDQQNFKSLIHSSVMFRTSVYKNVGGYRQSFYFAQDCDLWARMLATDVDVAVIEEVLQDNVFSASGISGRYASAQKALAQIVVQANQLRIMGKSDEDLLIDAAKWRPLKQSVKTVTNTGLSTGITDNKIDLVDDENFSGNYFIASILSKSQPNNAIAYWRKALNANPKSLRARLKLLWCLIKVKFYTLN